MPASFQEIINSRLFKFIVGETTDGVPTSFSVHEDAISQLSKPLESLVKGSLSEAQAACTVWKDVKKETFERFAQFAYTGDYSIPKTTKRNLVWRAVRFERNDGPACQYSSSSISDSMTALRRRDKRREEEGSYTECSEEPIASTPPMEAPTEALDEYERAMEEPIEDQPVVEETPHWEQSIKTKKKKSKRSTGKKIDVASRFRREGYPSPPSPKLLAADFTSIQYPLLMPRNNYEGTCEPTPEFKPDHSYTNVFLAHAALYIIGDYWLIDSLSALALYKLHQTLCIFQLDDINAEDVVALARYAYLDEGKGRGRGLGGLRDLVCQYMAANAVVLALDDGFMEYLAEGGQFVKDFVRFEIQRIH